MTNTNSKLATLFTLALVLAAGSSQAADLDDKHAWTTPGSVGIVESGEVKLHLGMANVTAAMPDGTTILRYNIAATDGLVGNIRSNQALRLDVKFRDAGDHARVRAFVMEGSMSDSNTAILASFDSDLVAADGTPPHQFRLAAAPMVEGRRAELDFQNNVYYLEVWLTKIGSSRIGPGFGGASLCVANFAE
jgi:hypothetical protein